MSDSPPATPELPPIGNEMTIPVLPHPGRVSIVAEQVMCFNPTPQVVEMVLLRRETMPVAQRGVILASTEQGVEVLTESADFAVHVFDVGHVRFDVTGAKAAIGSIAQQLVAMGAMSVDDVHEHLQMLQSSAT